MIRVTIELFPFGEESRRQVLAEVDIANDGTGDNHTGNYKYKVRNKGGADWKSGAVRGFRRAQFTVLYLLALVLRDAFPDFQRALEDERP